MMRSVLHIGPVTGLATIAFGIAQAATPQAPASIVLHGREAYVVAIPLLIQRGQFDDALRMVRAMPADDRADPAVLLLEAQLLRRTGAARSAVSVYRTLLARYPADQRVRLELGQTLFELEDLRSAEHYFRLALSGSLPAEDRKLARLYLNRILELRPWSVTAGFGVAPDSNVNGATSARQVELWGLPFDLSQEARRRSGLAFSGYVSGQGSVRLGRTLRLVGAPWVQANETRDRAFDTEAVGASLGPEWASNGHRLSLSATAERRWFGGRDLYSAAGAQIAGDLIAGGGRTAYSASLSAQRLDYDVLDDRDGWTYGADLTRTRSLSPTMFWRATGSLRVVRAAAPSEAYDQGRLAVGLYRTLPLRLAVYAEPAVLASRYKGRDPLFGVVREDRDVSLSARLIKEDYSIWGLSPYIGASVNRTTSNIVLYSYTRRRIEFGMTRTF